MRILWVSPQSEQPDCFTDSNLSFSNCLSWNPAPFKPNSDWAQEKALLSAAQSHDGVLISGMSLIELESIFKARALQLLESEGRLEVPAVILLPLRGAGFALPGLGSRMHSAWPFRSVIFVGDVPTVEFLTQEGLLAVEACDAKRLGLKQLFSRTDGAFATCLSNQSVGVQIQPLWLSTGSSTVFSNQIEALIDRGFFTLRVFIDSDVRVGPTLRRLLCDALPEATTNAAPHIETFACPIRDFGSGSHDQNGMTPESYLMLAHTRMMATMEDKIIARLAARASLVIVNYAVNVAFALRVCPDARVILETHDYTARQAIERARFSGDMRAFTSCTAIKQYVELERRMWSAADVCISLSSAEFKKMQRYCTACVPVIPRPYTRRCIQKAGNATWDILINASPHPLNIQSTEWFLENVIAGNTELAQFSVAIAGRIGDALEPRWRSKLQNVHWLGFVKDIEALRDSARLTVCPDLAGTGVSIKALSAIVAGHPLVATKAALRGLGDRIFDLIPVAESAEEMKTQIAGLLGNGELLKERSQQVSRAIEMLRQETGHQSVLSLAAKTTEDLALVRTRLLGLLGAAPHPIFDPVRFDGGTITLKFGVGGNEIPFLDRGWHWEETGGRWTDGASATLQIPVAWVKLRCRLEVLFVQNHGGCKLVMKYQNRTLPMLKDEPNGILVKLDVSKSKPLDKFIELELAVSSVFSPADEGLSEDRRILGAYIQSLKISRISYLDWLGLDGP